MFLKLGGVLEDIIEKTGIEGGIDRGRVILLWPKVVGGKIAAHACPYLFKKGTLFVAANSGVWAQELSLIKSSLIEKMNGYLGKELVRDMRFQARGVRLQPSFEPLTEKKTRAEIASVKLEEETASQIKEWVKDIPDGKLRRRMLDVAILDEKFKAWQRQHGFRECPNCRALIERNSDCRWCLSSRQKR